MGGATISFLNMICGIRQFGFEPVIVHPDNEAKFINILDKYGLEHTRIPLTPLILHVKSVKNKILYPYHFMNLSLRLRNTTKALEAFVDSVRPDIIHTNVGIIHEGYAAAQRFGIPHVWHLREYQDMDFGWKAYPSKENFEKKLYASHVVAISQGIFDHFNLSSTKDKVIYNGILHESEVAYHAEKEKFFLCASRVVASKGHEDVVRAFAAFHKNHPDYRLIILGDGHGKFIGHLKSLTQQLGCNGQICFEGYKTNAETVKYMQAAKALIVASHFEGFGRMTAEAAFAGCFVIGRDTGGTQEIISITSGLAFHNVDELAQAMHDVVAMSQDTYKRIVLQGQEAAIDCFSIERNIQNISQYYSSILD